MELKDKRVVVMGRFSQWRKSDLERELESLGAEITDAVSSEVDLVVAGNHPGARYNRANQLGLLVMGQDALDDILAQPSDDAPRNIDQRIEALRALVQRPYEDGHWGKLCEQLTAWPLDEEIEVGLDYCRARVLDWPEESRRSQGAWLELPARGEVDPRNELVSALHFYDLDASRSSAEVRQNLLDAYPQFPNVTQLTINHHGLDEDDAVAIADSPMLQGVWKLDLMYNSIGARGAKALAASQYAADVTYLDLRNNEIGVEGALALANSPYITNLTWLHLYANELESEGISALLGSPNMHALEELNLENNRFSPASMRALVKAECLENLKVLELRYNEAGVEGCKILAQSDRLRALHTLDLSANEIGDDGVAHLVSSPALRGLRSLRVEGNHVDPLITDEGCAKIARSEHLREVQELWLGQNEVTGPGLRALLESTTLASLRTLKIDFNDINSEGLGVFEERDLPVKLTSLNLCGNSFQGAGYAFSRAIAFETLEFLDIGFSDMREEDVLLFLENPGIVNLEELDLGSVQITSKVIEALAEVEFVKLARLNINGDKPFTCKAARKLASAPWASQLTDLIMGDEKPKTVQVLEEALGSQGCSVIAI